MIDRRELDHLSKDQRVSLFLRPIPRTLRDQFKAYCARRGMSMIRRLMEHMKDDIRTDKIGCTTNKSQKAYALNRKPIK